MVPIVKNPPTNAGDKGDSGSTLGLGRSLGRGHGNPLQFSCLENSMDREAWRAIVYRVAKSQTRLKRLSMHTHLSHRWTERQVESLAVDQLSHFLM